MTAVVRHRKNLFRAELAPSIVFAAALLVAAPVLAVLASLFTHYGETIRHVMATLGGDYVAGTLLLCLLAGGIGGAVGVAAAIPAALCDFPLRRVLSFALILPLAVPSYIVAYVYSDLVSPFGLLAGFHPPSIRNLPGAAFVLAISLFPYAYLTARAAFEARSAAMIEAARTLGATPLQSAIRILAPASRPAIAAGIALIMMETAAEFGVADYFGVQTLSVGIFRTWHSFGDLGAASQLASGLFAISAALVAIELISRRGRSSEAPRLAGGGVRFRLNGAAGAAVTLFCLTPVMLGFVIPVAALASKIGGDHGAAALRGLSGAFSNSALIAAGGAATTLILAIALAYAERRSNRPLISAVVRLATLGYAIPGAVIAIGVLSILSLLGSHAASAVGPVALIYAYTVRFLTAGHGAVAGGLSQIDRAVDQAARTLGATSMRILTSIHTPMMRRSIIAGITIVFVDIVKELPATLILRDFNFETLATRVYRLAGDERLAEAAPNALLLIALSAVPIAFLSNFWEKPKSG